MTKPAFSIISIVLLIALIIPAQSQKKDKANFIIYQNEFWEEIKESVEEFESKKEEKKKSFKMNFSGYDLPKSIEEFKQFWHNDPISQGWSGMCWNFSATSFYESEIYRIHSIKIKISELHTIYWEYVEKAKRFVKERGNSLFAEGSQANAVKRIWEKYGCVPSEVYSGKKTGQKHHGHEKMFNEMNNYLKSVKKTNAWNENEVIETIKSILNHYIGKPPEEFTYNDNIITPLQFFKDIVRLKLDDYVDILSLMQEPYYEKVEYKVPDNWWHSKEYYNIPVNEFMESLKNAVMNGYTMAIGGDISESGYNSHTEVAIVPTYDIPSEYIDDYSRQFRFSNGTTTDDHGIHIVGYLEKEGKFWFLIKDSGSGARNGKNKGYYFYQEDYIKLKIMSFTIHKSAVVNLLEIFK
ncbi:C1 family peptidase [Bacteroidota bacterium]